MTDVNIYDIGDNVTMAAAFTSNSVATDPTGVTFKIKLPSGAVTTYVYSTDVQLIKDSTGNYHVCWTITMKGTNHFRFAGTGALIAAEEDSFYVNETNFP